jgi:hypothetical protein
MAMQTTLTAGGEEIPNPSDADIDRVLALARDDDWYVTLSRGEDDSMEVMLDRGDLWVEADVEEKFMQARSYVDDAALRAMLIDFRDGGHQWRDLAAWAEPSGPSTHRPKAALAFGGAALLAFLALVITGIATDQGGWVGVAFALVLPVVIVIAVMVKQAEVKRAARWTKTTARIVRSEMARETRFDKQVQVPKVEFEYTVKFHRFRGRRVSLGEYVSGPDVLQRYRVGASVPAYVNPDDPTEAVLERDLPKFFGAIWGFAGALFAIIAAAAWWFLLR